MGRGGGGGGGVYDNYIYNNDVYIVVCVCMNIYREYTCIYMLVLKRSLY